MNPPNSAEDAVIVATVLIEGALNWLNNLSPAAWSHVDGNVQTKIVDTSTELARCIKYFADGTL